MDDRSAREDRLAEVLRTCGRAAGGAVFGALIGFGAVRLAGPVPAVLFWAPIPITAIIFVFVGPDVWGYAWDLLTFNRRRG